MAAQIKLLTIIKDFFPKGTTGNSSNLKGDHKWKPFPQWPPDLFAISASIIAKFDLYTSIKCPEKGDLFTDEEINELMEIGYAYSVTYHGKFTTKDGETVSSKLEIQKIWDVLINECKKIELHRKRSREDLLKLAKAATSLMIISDEASEGIGFQWSIDDKENTTWVNIVYQSLYWGSCPFPELEKQHLDGWNQLSCPPPKSQAAENNVTACILVPETVACVHPKVKIPQVGCTIRSMSHNLALLPSSDSVTVKWRTLADTQKFRKNLNIIAIPFPYNLTGNAFKVSQKKNSSRTNYFNIEPNWLSSNKETSTEALNPEHINELIETLVKQAKKHVNDIDIVIFPEAAMSYSVFASVYKKLKDETDILISGVTDESGSHAISSEFSGNAACISFIHEEEKELKKDISFFYQNKHHRWKLDSSQIETYCIGDQLDPMKNWWEDISIKDRSVNFFTFNEDSCFVTLVCEDLARIEPCQDIIRSIGPSIVFSLLMDGPQLKGRWPERYAMGLNDDPGCSILTLTSVGLLRRSNLAYYSNKQVIGLWRDSNGRTRELELPLQHDALLLTLNQSSKNQITLDGRYSGKKQDTTWKLTGAVPLKAKNYSRSDAL